MNLLKCYSVLMDIKTIEKKEEVLFSAMDRKYYRSFGDVWAWSIYKNGMHAHLHVINPRYQDIKRLKLLVQATEGFVNFTTGDENYQLPKDRSYFASFRFLLVQEFSNFYKKILITDIDSLIRKKIDFPNADFGFYHRKSLDTSEKWYKDGSKVAAGLVFINNDAQENASLFLETFKKNLFRFHQEGNWRWMVDQRSLFETYTELKTKYSHLKFDVFSETDLSWDFNEQSHIWTGKGDRKFKNKKYLKEFRKNKKEYQKKLRKILLYNFLGIE